MKLFAITLAFLIGTALSWESFWLPHNDTVFRFRAKFLKHIEKIINDGRPKTIQQWKLLDYYWNYHRHQNKMLDHNQNTNFLPKHLNDEVLIPHITHFIWTTNPDKINMMNYPNIWNMIEKLHAEDHKEGVEWKHIFWTNDVSSLVLNETACQGRCEIKLIWEIPGVLELKNTIDQFLKIKFYCIDLLRPYIIHEYGGIYYDADIHYVRSPKELHKLFDFYTGSESSSQPGLATGIIAAKPKHPAMKIWIDIMEEFYGYRQD